MSDTAMRAALEQAGLMPRHQPADAPRYGERSALHFVDTTCLSDKQVVDELAEIHCQVKDIQRQLDDDLEAGIARGEVWRANAKRARRGKLFRADQLTEEARKRGLVAALPETAERLAREAERQAGATARREIEAASAAAKEERRLERTRAHEAAAVAMLEKQRERFQHEQALQEAKLATHRLNNERSHTQAGMFVKAAHRLYSKDECDRIWARARELFADDPAWEFKETP